MIRMWLARGVLSHKLIIPARTPEVLADHKS